MESTETKSDITKIARETKSDITKVAGETESDVAKDIGETKSDVANIAVEIKSDIANDTEETRADIVRATGRRKRAVARVRITPGTGHRMANGKNFKNYFERNSILILTEAPVKLLGIGSKINIIANVFGGGIAGQAGAVRLGISRALVKLFPDRKAEIKKMGFLTRDARVVERKKYGRPKARKKFQFSKR